MANPRGLLAESQQLEWQRVKSSNLAAVAYAPDSARLFVEFQAKGKRPAALYCYHEVPEEVYRGLLSAASHGSYLDRHVKRAGFAYDQVY